MSGMPPGQPTLGLSDQKLFDHLKCEVLNASRYNLTNCLIPDRHMDFLRSKHILSQDDCEEITSPDTERKRASKFLDILMKKGAEAYDALCAALKEEGTQTFLLRQLNEDFERRYRNYRELVNPSQLRAELPIHPPSHQPPVPPNWHHQGIRQGPSEHEHIFQGYSSPPASPSECSCTSKYSGSGSSTLTADIGQEGGDRAVNLRRERMTVSEILRNLSVQQQDSGSGSGSVVNAPSSPSDLQATPSPGYSNLSSGASAPSDIPSFPSAAATCGSSFGSTGGGQYSVGQPGAPLSLPVPVQDLQVTVAGQHRHHRQHQRLSSRGSLQEFDLPSEGGVSGVHPSTQVPNPSCLMPVENVDTSTESNSLQAGSFFESLPNQSLAPSSQGSVDERPILCRTALEDQQSALGKFSDEKLPVESEENTTKEPADISLTSMKGTEGGSELSVLSAGHFTDVKSIPGEAPRDSSIMLSEMTCLSEQHLTNVKTAQGDSQGDNSSLSCDVAGSMSQSVSLQRGEVRGEEKEPEEGDGLQFEGGFSKESRASVHDKTGHGQHSTQC